MRNELEYIPAIIRSSEADLGILAAKINNAHEAGEDLNKTMLDSRRAMLQHYRQVGEMLLQVKERIGRGLNGWLQAHVKFSRSRAYQYLAWASVQSTGHSDDEAAWKAWQRICGNISPASQAAPESDDAQADEDRHEEPISEPHKEPISEPHVPLVTRNTGNEEWNTPPEYMDAARLVLGEIDLDPASNDIAQRTVRAKTYYTEETDGLGHPWSGRVWLNPPYTRDSEDDPGCKSFVNKLCWHYEAGDVSEAIVLTNNSTDTEWYHRLLSVSAMICVVKGRVKFLDKEGNPGGPTQGQTLFYLGDKPDNFIRGFAAFGKFLRLCEGGI